MTLLFSERGNGRMMREVTCGLVVAIALVTLPCSASAQTQPTASTKINTDKGAAADATVRMHKSMEDMQKKAVAMIMTGDPDTDFAMMMVAHHQGAIDMAEAELEAGKDPAMIKIAKTIIAAQKKEIAEFEVWLKKHPHAMK